MDLTPYLGSTLAFTGIDPGIVHTGIVCTRICIPRREYDEISVDTRSRVIEGLNIDRVAASAGSWLRGSDGVWVEGYKARTNLAHDKDMQQFNGRLTAKYPKVEELNNMGAKKIITKDLMQALNVWDFGQKTHHADLRSAARIMLYGMVKSELGNAILYTVMERYAGLVGGGKVQAWQN